MSHFGPRLERVRHRLATGGLSAAERAALEAEARRYEQIIAAVAAAPPPTDEQRAIAVRVMGPGMRLRAECRAHGFVVPAPVEGGAS